MQSKRRNYLIDKPFQLGFIFRYVFIVLISVIAVFCLFLLYHYLNDKIKKLDEVITVTQRGHIKYKGMPVFDYPKESIHVYKDKEGNYRCYQPFNSQKYKAEDIIKEIDEKEVIPLLGPVPKVVSRFELLFWPLLLLTITQIVIISIYSIFFSHKMAGPIYRMRVSLDRMLSGDYNFIIKVRRTDFFINIVERLEKLRQKILEKSK